MASRKVPLLQPFHGDSNEDVTTWITNCNFFLSLYELDGRAALRVIFSSLKGTAFDWARETITQQPGTTVPELLAQLSQRFLSDEIPDSIENFFQYDERCKLSL
ncbi:hypothetical protein ENBRE01_3135 [Enteropsectra breve]|nr:hypothetical protein ENBRE01_3135 [Enteropsectra breve]